MKLLAYLTFMLGMLVLILFPGSPYSWVQDMDPTIPLSAFEDQSGDRLIFVTLVWICVIAFQIPLFIRAREKWHRVIAVGLISAVSCLWFFKFMV